jgi:Tol biopolymer transport system component
MAGLIGQTLSHYRVTAALGAGGMGEVYRATDTKLGRDVAIKVLPPEVAGDAERLGRFQREAHLLASLNHPNIAAIHGLEEADGKPFLALELVEGEDLKERLAKGPIPVVEALEIAEQIAEALEEAHNKGIVHRDLKPANVKLTPDEKVKVLDFGLAKAWSGEDPDGSSPSAALSQSPTLAHTGTVAGVILGTAAYMSPEQARGKPVDKRADVWSFGVLLWEMLTGQALFAGDTVTDVIAAVVRAEPDLSALPAETPATVRKLLARCLRKDPRTRLPDIGAARLELHEVRTGEAAETAAPTAEAEQALRAERSRRTRERWTWAAVAAVLGAAALVLGLGRLGQTPPTPPPAGRFVVDAPDGWHFHKDWGWPVPSPDGSQIVFRAVPDGATNEDESSMLWTRPLEAVSARQLAGTERAGLAFWSPDGQFVAFFAQGELRKLNLASGTIQRICAVHGEQIAGGDWNARGTIVFSAGPERPDTVYTVSAAGGEPRPATAVPASETGVYGMAQFLPDGKDIVLLNDGHENTPPGVYVAPLSAPADGRRLLDGLVRLQYAGGYALFVRDGTLLAQPFDAEEATLTGTPVAVASSVAGWNMNPGIAWFGASAGGTLAYLTGQAVSGDVQLTWLDRKGGSVGTVGTPGDYGQIALSPDGRNVALEIRSADSGWDIWVMDVARGVASRVTAAQGDERNPVWSPDGRFLAFSGPAEGNADLRYKGLRAGDPETVVVDTDDNDYPEAWLPDGGDLLFIRREPVNSAEAKQSLWRVSSKPGGEPEPLESSGFFVDEPQVSPDGRWLAYNSQESGRSEVYVEPYGRDGDRVRVSVDGGGQPKWRADGEELFFTDLDGQLMSVAFRGRGDRAEVDLPTPLFEIGGFEGPDYDDYAPSADGQRFLVKLAVEQGQRTRMHVVTNWTSLLER